MRELQKLAEEKQLDIDVKEPSNFREAEFDEGKIIQVINNLMSNAIKFSPTGGKIKIRFGNTLLTAPEESSDSDIEAVWFSVSDRGIGIPDDELEKVFDKFIQSSKTTTGAGGTGLGLAICQEIIHGHNGRIWCENNSEGGARFTFVIPIKAVLSESKPKAESHE